MRSRTSQPYIRSAQGSRHVTAADMQPPPTLPSKSVEVWEGCYAWRAAGRQAWQLLGLKAPAASSKPCCKQ